MILTYKGLKIEIPYDAIQVEDIEIVEPINDHASLRLKVLIDEGKISEYINKNINEDKVTVIKIDEETNEETRLFIGKINEVFMSYESELHMMEIKCISYTKDFDIKKNSRTFCNLDMTYAEVIQKVLEPYAKKDFIDNITNGQAIREFILQYEETDWEFLRRIASHFNGVLLSEFTEDYGRFHFGIPQIDNNEEIDLDDYEVIKDINTYNKREALEIEDNFLQEYTTWDIVSSKKLILGEQVTFNKVKCVVAKIHIGVYKEEIRTVYTLGLERGLRSTYKVNHNIFGMSIPATVKDVKGNTMSVHFEIDPVYEAYSNQKYFTYAIESSAWYCMPEKESKVHIYFPTNYEKDSIAVHAVRAHGKDAKYAGRTQNPDNKSFSNVTGSEMKLTPSDMSFAADDSRNACLTLAQSGDVSLVGKNINFMATENLELGMRDGEGDIPPFRPQNIVLSAKNSIKMSKGQSLGIQMDTETFVQGSIIKYEGSIKDALELQPGITEIESKDEALRSEANAKAQAEVEARMDEAKEKMGFGRVAQVIGTAAFVVGLAVATAATGGAALVVAAGIATVGGLTAFTGECEYNEGASDYKKIKSGNFQPSPNFIKDKIFNGDQKAYDNFKYGLVMISGVAVGFLIQGPAAIVEAAYVGGGDIGINLVSDYIDDGEINRPPEEYIHSAELQMGLAGIGTGIMSPIAKYGKEAKIPCGTIGKARFAVDMGVGAMGEMATSGDVNWTSLAITTYVSNKFCFLDQATMPTGTSSSTAR